jgi:hypothetical protein
MGPELPISINLMGRVYDPLDEQRLDEARMHWRSWLEGQAGTLVAPGHRHRPTED